MGIGRMVTNMRKLLITFLLLLLVCPSIVFASTSQIRSVVMMSKASGNPTYLDDFNRGNGVIGADWGPLTGENGLQISAYTLKNITGDRGGARRVGETYSDNQYSKIQILTRDTIGGAGPCVRVSASAETYYNAAVISSTTTLILRKNISGSFSTIQSFTIPTWTDGQYIKLAVSGSTLTWTIYASDGVTVVATDSATDSSISTGSPGVFIYNPVATMDNWSGGDV